MSESLFTSVIIWVLYHPSTILIIEAISPKRETFWDILTFAYPTGIKKNVKSSLYTPCGT